MNALKFVGASQEDIELAARRYKLIGGKS